MDRNCSLLKELITESINDSLIFLKNKISDDITIVELSILCTKRARTKETENIMNMFSKFAENIDIILNDNKVLLCEVIQNLINESSKNYDSTK